jgi:hypothetical protein
MAEQVKRIAAVAFFVASVPVLLLPGKFTIRLNTGPGPLTSQEGDRLAKKLLALKQKVSDLKEEHAIPGAEASISTGESRRLGLDNGTRKQEHDVHPIWGTKPLGGTRSSESAPLRRLSDSAAQTLQRRAVYTRWGSTSCPMGSMLLYSGFMSTSHFTHSGSGYNMLCMHPSPQLPSGYDAADNNGALLYGVEYENTGAIDRHKNYDAACAVCQWQNGATVFVEWGNAESRHNPSTPKTCSNPAHEMIYTGLIMSEKYTHQKGEYLCVDLERAYYGEAPSEDERPSDHNGGLLYTTEMEQGSADEYAYPHNREVGCTVCGIPAKSVDAGGVVAITPGSETDVFTVWGKRHCPGASEQLYKGFMAGSHYNHGGSGSNYICMTTDNPNPPSGFSDGNQASSLLYGTEYENTGAIDANHNGDAACAVCRYFSPHKDVYVQWGRSNSCSNSHAMVYQGYVMGEKYTHHRSTRVCVHTFRETHPNSSSSSHDGALLYTTELERTVSGVSVNHEVGCSSCAGDAGESVYTRWGSRSCPAGSSVLYEGTMMSEFYSHRGGGANTVCVHSQMQTPAGSSSGNQNGHLLYTMEYENTGAIDANHNHEAACAVCELDHWESVYTQWGRSTTCTNGHLTLYTGFVMAERYTHNKGEFVCVDSERAVTLSSSSGNQNGGLLYSTEMEGGSSDEDKYPHNVEVGCMVCAPPSQAQEVPFVKQLGVGPNGESYFKNAIHGEWVKIASLAIGQSVTVSYGYTVSGGTSSSAGETQSSAQSRAHDVSMCASTSYTASVLNTVEASTPSIPLGKGVSASGEISLTVGYSSTSGLETCRDQQTAQETRVGRAMTQATSWDQSITESRSFSLSIPSQLPAGVPEAETISTLGVDVWQWQWTIFEGAQEGVSAKKYKAKAESRFVFAPVPTGDTERRPCCMPSQEYGVLWYPFNCKTTDGLLPGAENAAHCKVGAPGSSVAQGWSTQDVVQWLSTLDLSQSYDTVVSARRLDGHAIDSLIRFVDESPASYSAVTNVYGTIPSGDALKILRGLIELRTAR